MRRTKIVCTLGPSTDQGDVMETLVREGMDVANAIYPYQDYGSRRILMTKAGDGKGSEKEVTAQ